jgi:hypothetical protein
VSAVPRPTTKLTAEQRRLLEVAVKTARERKVQMQELDQEIWDAALAARRAGVPDDLLCDETGLSRATMNRRFGNRKAIEQEAATDE